MSRTAERLGFGGPPEISFSSAESGHQIVIHPKERVEMAKGDHRPLFLKVSWKEGKKTEGNSLEGEEGLLDSNTLQRLLLLQREENEEKSLLGLCRRASVYT